MSSPPASAAAGKTGSADSARLTLATVPGVRMLPARQSRFGPDGDRVGEAGQGLLRIEAADDDLRLELVAGRQDDAGRPAVVRGDGHHLGVGPDLHAGRLGRLGERRGDRAGPAPSEDRLARGSPVVAGRVTEQDRGRAGGPRAHRRVLHAAPGDGRLQGVGLERLRHEVGDGHRQDPGQGPRIGPAEATERPPEREPGERIADARCRDVRWRPTGEIAEEPGQRADEAIEADERVGVVAGPRAQAIGGPDRIRPQHDGAAVAARRERPDLRADQREPMRLQAEIADDASGPAGRRCGPASGRGRPGASCEVPAAPPTVSRRSRTSVRMPALPR